MDFSLIVSKSPESNYDFKVFEVLSVSPCSSELKFNLTVDENIEGNDVNITLSFTPNSSSIPSGSVLGIGGGERDGARPRNDSPRSSGRGEAVGSRPLGLGAQCILASKNKKNIFCEMGKETADVNYIMKNYFSFDEKQLISIVAYKDLVFPLYCHEESPISAIIFISAVFLFVVIVVIVVVIFMNKKGRGNRGYDSPNNLNGDIAIGISSSNIQKV